MSDQPTALQLAAQLDAEVVRTVDLDMTHHRAAAELRRMHDRIEADEALLRQALEALVAVTTARCAGMDISPIHAAYDKADAAIAAIRARQEGKA